MFYAYHKETKEIRYICPIRRGTEKAVQNNPEWEICETAEEIKLGYDGKYYIASELPEKPSEILAKEIREKRNRLLFESDWTQTTDVPISETEKNKWKVYRQALRDITKQEKFPAFVVFPKRL